MRYHYTKRLIIASLLIAILAGGSLLTAHQFKNVAAAKTKASQTANPAPHKQAAALGTGTTTAPSVSVATSSPSKTLATSPKPASSRSIIISAPQCSPNTSWGNTNSLSALNGSQLAASPNQVVKIIDPTTYYRVYGYTPVAVNAQIGQCSPVHMAAGTFYAETRYAVDADFSLTMNSQGMCQVSDPSVGAHFAQVFPAWVAGPNDSASLDQRWPPYIASLQAYENQHITIIMQHANQLLIDLENFPPSSPGPEGCSDTSAVRSYINTAIVAAYAADTTFDVGAHYGPTFIAAND